MLNEKLEWLYRLRGLSGYKLGEKLGIAPWNITHWIHTVPIQYLLPSADCRPTLCTIFGVPYRAFEATIMEEFKYQIEQRTGQWTRLVEQAADAPELNHRRPDPRPVARPQRAGRCS